MLCTKRRRALASMILVSAVLLLPVRTASAAPRGGMEREGERSFRGMVAHWEHLVWNIWASLFEKSGRSDNGAGFNPDGVQLSANVSDGH